MARLNDKELRDLKMTRLLLEMKSFAPSEDPRFKSQEEVRAFIDEQTRIWRDSWIFPAIDRIIDSATEARKKRKAK